MNESVQRGPSSPGRGGEILWSGLLLAAVGYLLIQSARVASPIMSSDEYAFFISGKFFDHYGSLIALEANVPRLSNLAFFSFVRGVFAVTEVRFTVLLRLVHLAEYGAAIWILLKIAHARLDRSTLAKGAVVVLLLPNSIYSLLVMPEADLVFLTVCIAWATIVLVRRYPLLGSVGAALPTCVAILVKPHAVATLVTAATFIALSPWIGGRRVRPRTATAGAMLYVLASYGFVVVLWRWTSDAWQLDPRVLLGLNFYGQALQATSASAFYEKVGSTVAYAGAHAVVLLMIFGTSIVFLAREAVSGLRRQSIDVTSEQSSRFAIFTLLLIAAHIMMAAWFTAGAAQLSPASEALRLHARYLTPSLVFIAVVAVRAVERLDRRHLLLATFVMLAGLAVFLAWILPTFKIYPWDNPLLFAFFQVPNHYLFDFGRNLSWLAIPLIVLLVALGVLALLVPRATRACLVAFTIAILLVGNAQTYRWVFERGSGLEPLVAYGRAVAALTGGEQFGKGLVVTDRRYGELPTMLFGLGSAPRVLFKDWGGKLSAEDIKGAEWILLTGDYSIDFPYFQEASIGPFRFFPGGSGLSARYGPKGVLHPGETAIVELIAGKYPEPLLEGFNVAEPWGRWSGQTLSSVVLPAKIHGRIRISVSGWTLLENQSVPLVIRAGSASAKFEVPTTPNEIAATLDVQEETDRLELESPVAPPDASGRALGVAIGRIKIDAL